MASVCYFLEIQMLGPGEAHVAVCFLFELPAS